MPCRLGTLDALADLALGRGSMVNWSHAADSRNAVCLGIGLRGQDDRANDWQLVHRISLAVSHDARASEVSRRDIELKGAGYATRTFDLGDLVSNHYFYRWLCWFL